MRWLLGALLLLGTGPLLAQSLGDVVRQQRDDTTAPKAKHVFTNADLASPSDATAPASPETTVPGPHSAKAAGPSDTDRAQAATQQRRVNELNQRVQLLTSELADLEGQVNALKRGAVYGDPNRAQQNEEIRRLSVAVEEKRAQLTSARDELSDEVERSRKASVLK